MKFPLLFGVLVGLWITIASADESLNFVRTVAKIRVRGVNKKGESAMIVHYKGVQQEVPLSVKRIIYNDSALWCDPQKYLVISDKDKQDKLITSYGFRENTQQDIDAAVKEIRGYIKAGLEKKGMAKLGGRLCEGQKGCGRGHH
ncbi:hypothetical protein ANO11243_092720 [Dothideomycetidae sp. 11243]|nr:hypothetical protein ANO11243_092720 [fungal sp. No.11243]